MNTDTITLRVLCHKEEQSQDYLAQCLEYDLVAQGATVSEAIKAFVELLVARFEVGAELKVHPLKNVPPAPKRYFALFESAELQVNGSGLDKALLPHVAAHALHSTLEARVI